MSFIITLAMVMFVLLVACIIGYVFNTNSIIKDQEKQIARLSTEKIRLQAALNKASNTQVIEIHDSTVNPENVPDYNPF